MGITQKELAELAGVSVGTVDRAMHDRGRINPEVAARIKRLAQELGYKPNSVAKGLSNSKGNTRISVILHITTINEFFGEVLKGINEAIPELSDRGITTEIVKCPDFDEDAQLRLIDEAVEGGSKGIIIVPIASPAIAKRLNDLASTGFPVIFLTNIIEDVDYLSFVGCDYEKSGRVAAGLLNLVNREKEGKLLIFTPSLQMHGHVMRYNGLADQIKKFYPNIKIKQVIEVTGNDIHDFKVTEEAVKAHPDVNLILSGGAYSKSYLDVIRQHAIDAEIVCYDTSPMINEGLKTGFIKAAITQQPRRQGNMVMKIMLQALKEGREDIGHDNFLSSRIILREHLNDAQDII